MSVLLSRGMGGRSLIRNRRKQVRAVNRRTVEPTVIFAASRLRVPDRQIWHAAWNRLMPSFVTCVPLR